MLYDKIQEAARYILGRSSHKADVGIILGTGLGRLAEDIEADEVIDYQDIPHFPAATVQGHAGKLILGKIAGANVVAMAGRFHYYEGYTMQQVTFPVRVLRALRAGRLIISNAAGSTNPAFEAGDLVFIKDHINLQPDNPLRGPNDERLGLRFPDLLHTYDADMLERAVAIASEQGIRAHRGTYVALQGPNLETPAEYEFLHRIGADVVGMSTVPEVLVAKHAGMRVFVVSVVSNKSYPIEAIRETTIETVIETVRAAEPNVALVVKKLLAETSRPVYR